MLDSLIMRIIIVVVIVIIIIIIRPIIAKAQIKLTLSSKLFSLYSGPAYGLIITCCERDISHNTPCPEKSLHFFLNNFVKLKLTITVFGTHYADDTFY